jgi:hypothetical protein
MGTGGGDDGGARTEVGVDDGAIGRGSDESIGGGDTSIGSSTSDTGSEIK